MHTASTNTTGPFRQEPGILLMSLPPAMNAPIHRRIETSGVQIAGAIAVILLLAVSFLSAQPQAVSDLTAFSGSPEGRVTMRRASPGHGEYGFKRAGNPDSFALTGTNHGKFFTPGIAPYEQMLLYVNNPQGDKVTGKILGKLAAEKVEKNKDIEELHPRELQVLSLAAKGESNKQIACQLDVSERTVQTHMVNIFRKLRVSSRTEAVLQGLRQGWLTLDDLPSIQDASA